MPPGLSVQQRVKVASQLVCEALLTKSSGEGILKCRL
jgi:hypothetical protein